MNEPEMNQPNLGHASDQPDINDRGDTTRPAHGEVAGSPPATGTGQLAPGASPTQPATTSGTRACSGVSGPLGHGESQVRRRAMNRSTRRGHLSR